MPVIRTDKKPSRLEAFSANLDLLPPSPLSAVKVSPTLAKALRERLLDTLPIDLPTAIKNVLAKTKNVGMLGKVEMIDDAAKSVEAAYTPLALTEYLANRAAPKKKLIEAVSKAREALTQRLATNDVSEAVKALEESRMYSPGLKFNRPYLGANKPFPIAAQHELVHLGQDMVDPGAIVSTLQRYRTPQAAKEAYFTNPLEIGANLGAARRFFGNDPEKIRAFLNQTMISRIPPWEMGKFQKSIDYIPMSRNVRDVLTNYIETLRGR